MGTSNKSNTRLICLLLPISACPGTKPDLSCVNFSLELAMPSALLVASLLRAHRRGQLGLNSHLVPTPYAPAITYLPCTPVLNNHESPSLCIDFFILESYINGLV